MTHGIEQGGRKGERGGGGQRRKWLLSTRFLGKAAAHKNIKRAKGKVGGGKLEAPRLPYFSCPGLKRGLVCPEIKTTKPQVSFLCVFTPVPITRRVAHLIEIGAAVLLHSPSLPGSRQVCRPLWPVTGPFNLSSL